MGKKLSLLLQTVLLVIVCCLPALAETIKCAECGMIVDTGPFTSRITEGNKTLHFCDIGDLLTYLNAKQPRSGKIEVRDYKTGDWLDAHKAFYVHADKKFRTPMGWGIAGFKEEKDAAAYGSVMDFENASKAVR